MCSNLDLLPSLFCRIIFLIFWSFLFEHSGVELTNRRCHRLKKKKVGSCNIKQCKMKHIYRLEQIKRWQVVQLRQQSRDFSLLVIETTIEKKQEDNKSPEEKLSKIFKSSAGETRRSSRWTFLTGNRVSQVNNVLQNYLERTKS